MTLCFCFGFLYNIINKPGESMKNIKGFTFIEILIVIGIITLLATAVVVMVNPAKRFEAARDKQREIHLQTILSAIEQKITIEGGWFNCDPLPQGVIEEGEEEEELTPIFKTIGTGEGESNPDDFYNLFDCLVPKYMVNPLYDPDGGSEADTHYQIWQNPQTKYVTLRYVKDDDEDIVVGAKKYYILSAPTVITKYIEDITQTTAKVGGEVTDDGGASVLERGVVWGIYTEPTILTDDYITSESGLGLFEGEITGLTYNTQYYVCTYAKNDIGVDYDCYNDVGNHFSFYTLDARPRVDTLTAIDITVDQATLRGRVTSLGPPDVELAWGYFKLNGVEIGGSGRYLDLDDVGEEFIHTILASDHGLEVGVNYPFEACAYNYDYGGERCGATVEFSLEAGVPLVNTDLDPANVYAYKALIGGEVENTGGSTVIAWGICFAEDSDPVYPGDCLIEYGSEENPFPFDPIQIGGEAGEPGSLSPGTPYSVFAFAENQDVGPGFGETLDFTTKTVAPIIEETIIDTYDHHSAVLGGDITATGGAPITEHGVCWSIGGTPPLSEESCIFEGSIGLGEFTYTIRNFLADNTYNVVAFAINEKGLTWAEEPPEDLKSFTTLTAEAPGLGPTEVTDNTQSTASFRGRIENHGGVQIENYGFCWSQSEVLTPPEDPPTDGGCHSFGSTTLDVTKDDPMFDFIFTFTAEELTMNKDYNVWAFAKNSVSADYGYGSVAPFHTDPPGPPSVETYDITENRGDEVDAGGKVTDNGGDPQIIAGICYANSLVPLSYPGGSGVTCTEDWDYRDGMVWDPDDPNNGVFTSTLVGLIAGDDYHYVAYVQNNAYTEYGPTEINFTAGLALGDICEQHTDCFSGHCVDGVCCDDECSGSCQVCNSEGACTTRSVEDNVECSQCQRCDGTNTSCQNTTANNGKDCTEQCTRCINGVCTTRPADDNTECSTCRRCNGTSLDTCEPVDAGEQNLNCTSVCKACNGSGACVNQTVYGLAAQALGCSEAASGGAYHEECRWCNNGDCTNIGNNYFTMPGLDLTVYCWNGGDTFRMWPKPRSCGGTNYDNGLLGPDAIAYCANLEWEEYNDWVMPNHQSLTDLCSKRGDYGIDYASVLYGTNYVHSGWRYVVNFGYQCRLEDQADAYYRLRCFRGQPVP